MAVENWPVGWFFCKLLGQVSSERRLIMVGPTIPND